MKILSFIFLLSLCVTPSFATSQKCVDNYNKAHDLYKEGMELYGDAGDNYDSFKRLKDMVTTGRWCKDQTKPDCFETTVEAVNLLNKALAQTREAELKFKRGDNYSTKAQEYCYGETAAKNRQNFDTSQNYLSQIKTRLTGIKGEDWDYFSRDYSRAKIDFLYDLIKNMQSKSAIYIIEHEDIDLNHKIDAKGWSFLHTATSYNALDIVKALIAAGADINQQTDQGYTPLMLAAIYGYDKLFSYFLEQGASPFQLTGFHTNDQYQNCNLADLVVLAKTGHSFDGSGFNLSMLDLFASVSNHQNILNDLQRKGLEPVCNLNPVIATVNGVDIFKSNVDAIFNLTIRPQIKQSGQKLSAEQKTQFEMDILNHIILQEIQAQLARKKGLTADIKRRDYKIRELINKFVRIDKGWLEHYIENEMLAQLIIQKKIIDHIKVPEQDLRRYYKEHPDLFQKPATICARHIIVKSKEDAQRILALAKKDPENFAELAKQFSTGPSASQGGDLGCFNRDRMVKEFSAAAFALDAGEISDVVQTQFGYHIIKVTSKTPAEAVPFAEVRDDLAKWFKNQQAEEKTKKWEKELLASADIKIYR